MPSTTGELFIALFTMETTTLIPDRLQVIKEFENFIVEQDHPCIMAQSVFKMGEVELHTYNKIGDDSTTTQLLNDLGNYLGNYNFGDNDFRTFIASFPTEAYPTEEAFEQALWGQLQQIHDHDSEKWDETVSSNPENKNFSFSILGKAFYIVGMHPQSSRYARRSPYPSIVFNLHWQFEKLREMKAYENVRDKIRERDKALQGDINPVLEDFGKSSEALQYSGRNIGKEWKCPFHAKNKEQ